MPDADDFNLIRPLCDFEVFEIVQGTLDANYVGERMWSESNLSPGPGGWPVMFCWLKESRSCVYRIAEHMAVVNTSHYRSQEAVIDWLLAVPLGNWAPSDSDAMEFLENLNRPRYESLAPSEVPPDQFPAWWHEGPLFGRRPAM